ncbi:hypothetical protein GQ457_12G018830 [Hibiscus cannabinus]
MVVSSREVAKEIFTTNYMVVSSRSKTVTAEHMLDRLHKCLMITMSRSSLKLREVLLVMLNHVLRVLNFGRNHQGVSTSILW